MPVGETKSGATFQIIMDKFFKKTDKFMLLGIPGRRDSFSEKIEDHFFYLQLIQCVPDFMYSDFMNFRFYEVI